MNISIMLPSIDLAMKICNCCCCCCCWVSICNQRCHRSVQCLIMYPIVSNRISYLEEKARKKNEQKYKHNIARMIWKTLFFLFLSVCIWSSSSQASITTHIHSRPRCTRREPNCRNAFCLSLSLSLVANTTAVAASTSIVSIIIISFTLLFCLPFFSILTV
jgi:hypothetical protein